MNPAYVWAPWGRTGWRAGKVVAVCGDIRKVAFRNKDGKVVHSCYFKRQLKSHLLDKPDPRKVKV